MTAAAAGPLRLQWTEGRELPEGLADAWSDLVGRDPEASLFHTWEWLAPWWRHLGRGELRLLTVWRGARLAAAVPLVRRRERQRGLHVWCLRLVGDPESDRGGVLVDAADAEALETVVAALRSAAAGSDVLCLSELTAGSPFERALDRGLAEAAVARPVCSRAPWLPLDRPWGEIEAAYPSSLRTRLKRARKRHLEAGGLTFRRWQPEGAEIPQLLPRLREVERRSWKGQEGVGVFGTPARWAFFGEAAVRLAEKRWLDVATFEKDGDLVAYRFGFRFRGVFLDYNLAHDPAFERLSPGRVLLDEIVRDSHRLGLAAVDASRGGLEHAHLLADWPTAVREHTRWMVFGRTLRARTLGFLERRVKPWIDARRRAAAAAPEAAV